MVERQADMPNKTAPPPADAIRARREAMTPEEIAERIVGEVQLTDNAWQQADEVGIELRQLIVVALRAVAAETVEQSCKAVCRYCRAGGLPVLNNLGRHIHSGDNGQTGYLCDAEAIRARYGLTLPERTP